MTLRTDIQALRGLAVLLVLLHHAKFDSVAAGYLGVDIFFVISGYLITGMVAKDILNGTFTFRQFYFRRAKRLLPAAYVTFFVVALLSPLTLNSIELNDFAWQLAGAITFSGNIALWQQTDYFASSAELKPLLHVWSLAIEEQYYLLLPASLVLIQRKYWFRCCVIVVLVSLLLCVALMQWKPVAAFYLLPTRAWELGIGSLAAFIQSRGSCNAPALKWLFFPALGLVVLLPIFPVSVLHPGADALLICVGTAIIILRRHAIFDASPSARMFSSFGDFSYSLYLVHWPIFAFMTNAYVSEPPSYVYLIGACLSIIVGYGLYRTVESPTRRMRTATSNKAAFSMITTSVLLAALPFTILFSSATLADYRHVRRPNAGFGIICDTKGSFNANADCRDSQDPQILVWGDSYAMHLVQAIRASTQASVIQATRSVCGPFVGIAPLDHSSKKGWGTFGWAKECLAFNDSVLDYLAHQSSVEVVVLSSPFGHYLSPNHADGEWRTLIRLDGEVIDQTPSLARALVSMRETIQSVRALGKRVVVIAPPPASGFDIGACLERRFTGKLILGAENDCRISLSMYRAFQARAHEFLHRVSEEADVEVVWFDQVLCSEVDCVAEIDSTFLYRDAGHLSVEGSQLLGKRMNLGELVRAKAR